MPPSEFAIIDRYFKTLSATGDNVVLGPGDDCAILRVPDDHEICVSTDTLLEGVHFLADAPASVVASRTLAANLSDLAAMGAVAHSFVLAMTLPTVDEQWLEAFSSTLAELSKRYEIPLVGGNISRGNLSLTVTVIGIVPTGQAICRNGAKVGDDIYVTGTLGDAAAGLEQCQLGVDLDLLAQRYLVQRYLVQRYNAPTPRLQAGQALRGIATAMIDISDGFMADVAHIGEASECGVQISVESLPLSDELRALFTGSPEGVASPQARRLALFGGDDYELCFTASADDAERVAVASANIALGFTKVGVITAGREVAAIDRDGNRYEGAGYQHF
jgi:thiamine-monophosphate kinase